MEVRRYNWWPIALAVGLAVVLLIAFMVWMINAGSERETREVEVRTEPSEPAPMEQPEPLPPQRREPPRQTEERTVIRDSTEVREIVRERPVYVYVERPDREGSEPSRVIAVPQGQESRYQGNQYERITMPAQIELNGATYYLRPGELTRQDTSGLNRINRQVEGYQAYTMKEQPSPADTVFLRLEPDSDLYVPYDRLPEETSTGR